MTHYYRWIITISLCGLAGCASKGTRIELTTYDGNGTSRLHYTDFTRASYRSAPTGTLELVLESEQPSTIDPAQTITQILYIKTFWQPRFGTTYAEATQINAHVRYALLTPPTGVRYDGTAFISYTFNRRTGGITGKIESGTISPRYRIGEVLAPFGPARFTGTFQATENPSHVVNTLQMLETQFTTSIKTTQTQ